jgi:pimeloyl-ACP methyl ester carboxylesterase
MPTRLRLIVFFVLAASSISTAQDRPSAEFVQVRTDDGVVLSGAVWATAATPRPTALVMTLTGEFYDYAEWGSRFAADGFLTISLNRRDSGSQAGYHPFEPSARDLKYAVDLAFQRGARQVVILGLSYGTVVTSYYLVSASDSRVKGAVLLSPLADFRSANMRSAGEAAYNAALQTARTMVASGKGDDVFTEPGSAERTGRPTLTTYAVFLDKRGPDTKAVPAELLKTVKIPILAVRDPDDPAPGTLPPAQQRLEAASDLVTFVLLPEGPRGRNGGVIHRLGGRETEVVALVRDWLAKHGL